MRREGGREGGVDKEWNGRRADERTDRVDENEIKQRERKNDRRV